MPPRSAERRVAVGRVKAVLEAQYQQMQDLKVALAAGQRHRASQQLRPLASRDRD
jgi:hypothetical protein